MSDFSFRIKQEKAEVCKKNVTVTSATVATTKFLFGICKCTGDSDVDNGDFSSVLWILHACGHEHVRSHVSPGMDWVSKVSMYMCLICLHVHENI